VVPLLGDKAFLVLAVYKPVIDKQHPSEDGSLRVSYPMYQIPTLFQASSCLLATIGTKCHPHFLGALLLVDWRRLIARALLVVENGGYGLQRGAEEDVACEFLKFDVVFEVRVILVSYCGSKALEGLIARTHDGVVEVSDDFEALGIWWRL
jgi:hypothetical protein